MYTVVKGKIRDNGYLSFVRGEECLVCGFSPCDPHHLMHADDSEEMQRGMGLKNGDDLAVPLCRQHHDSMHRFGREKVWWTLQGVDPVRWAKENWEQYNDNRKR